MAEADPDMSESVDLKLFSFFVGFGAKGTPDSDVGRSPTSPLDLGVFANFGGLFSPRPSSPNRNKWVSDKVGLSVLSSSIRDGDEDEAHSGSFRRDNIVLAPQIKAKLSSEVSVKSNSLPHNIHPHPCVGDTVVEDQHNSPRRSSSSPVDIISTQAYSREMALSEDYTCIISHGPNPKTTHIFGDCILDCDPLELGTKEETEKPDGGDDSSSRVCLCTTGKPEDCHIHSEASAGEKGGAEDSLDISPGSSYNEDLFPMAMPLKS